MAPAHAAEASRARSRGGRGRGSHAGDTRGSKMGQPSIGAAAAPTSRRRPAPMRRNPKKEGPPRRDSFVHLGADGPSPQCFISNIASTMARSLGASMARGLGILLIMMTLSEIAATRAAPRPATQRAAPSPWRRHRAPPAYDSRRWRRAAAAAWPRRPQEGQRARVPTSTRETTATTAMLTS